MDNMTDEQLIDRIRHGHSDAYRVLVERHKSYIYTIIYRMVGHKETAEDLTQDVFVKLFRSLAHFRGDAKFTTWLYRMTTNLVTDYRRSQKRRPYEALLDKMKGWFTDAREQPEELALRKDEQERMQALLAELPDKYRLIMYLFHYKQLSYQEMSLATGLPVKTLETRLYRGKAMLKEKWLEVNSHDAKGAGGHPAHAIPK
ncbi:MULTISPECIES: RNA polymerase sigma factor [Paenibacillus]|uniref:RNA polymerase subunit sigma-70 n=2 Tax=Paenibacillus TaxID=44249 RepID=A0A1V4HI40_9BACL|nr:MULTISPECIES: sigma-70 family RNA polymerase sigma factor [Paenibacillus]MEC0230658.1 sigma-70 family RNA polymerase sigma factor [Paenibacillus alba]NQX71526.1 sigma-70 family RNA polymerase sigma factor [Paenibacillus alba]OPH56552.1 RNA polymerase subunit sigma-70 [Paenibacillus ferrarius]